MSIKNSAIDSDLKNEEAVKFEAQTNCKSKEWSSFLCVLALASVIKRKIFSHFPDCRDEMQRVLKIKGFAQEQNVFQKFLFMFYFVNLVGKDFMKKGFFQADHFVPLIQLYNQSRKRKRALQHLQTQTKKSKINVKIMLNSNFIQKSRVPLSK